MQKTFLILAACAALAPLSAQAAPSSHDVVVGWDANLRAEVRVGAQMCAYTVKHECFRVRQAVPVPGVVTGYFEDGTSLVQIDGETWVASQADVNVILRNGSRLKLTRWIMGNRPQ